MKFYFLFFLTSIFTTVAFSSDCIPDTVSEYVNYVSNCVDKSEMDVGSKISKLEKFIENTNRIVYEKKQRDERFMNHWRNNLQFIGTEVNTSLANFQNDINTINKFDKDCIPQYIECSMHWDRERSFVNMRRIRYLEFLRNDLGYKDYKKGVLITVKNTKVIGSISVAIERLKDLSNNRVYIEEQERKLRNVKSYNEQQLKIQEKLRFAVAEASKSGLIANIKFDDGINDN